MWRIVVLLLLLCVPAQAAYKAAVNDKNIKKTITHDLGGVISAYEQKYFGPGNADTTWVIDGFCDSACTMVLGTKSYCATPRAMIGFHAGYGEFFFIWKKIYPAYTYMMYKHYPPAVQKWVDANHAMDQIAPLTFLAGAEGAHISPAYGVVKGKVSDFVPACPTEAMKLVQPD